MKWLLFVYVLVTFSLLSYLKLSPYNLDDAKEFTRQLTPVTAQAIRQALRDEPESLGLRLKDGPDLPEPLYALPQEEGEKTK